MLPMVSATLCSCLFLMAIHSFIGIHLVCGLCSEDQKSLLMELKNSLNYDESESKVLALWDENSDYCDWVGVTCSDGCVIGLDLNSEGISGGFDNSSTLFSLRHLKNLNLGFNNFNVTIPTGFRNLANLTTLNASNAGFRGQIPFEISYLTQLITLDLSTFFTQLVTPYLSPIFYEQISNLNVKTPNLKMLLQNMSQLGELYLDGVDISAGGEEWGQALSSSLPNLRVLSLRRCNLSGPIDSSLLKIQSLSVIKLSGNNLSVQVPDFFAEYSNLISLELSSTGLLGVFPEKIFQVPTLQTLDLSSNSQLQGSLPAFPLNGSSLQSLSLGLTAFSGPLPDSIGNLEKLSNLDLSGCNFNGSIPTSISNLRQLTIVRFSDNKFSGTVPSFSLSKNLTRLNLARNQLDGSIPTAISNLRQLTFVDFSANRFSEPVPSFSLSKNLIMLNLANNQLNGSILSTKWESLSSLVYLNLRNNLLTGRIPVTLFSIPSIQLIDLSLNQFNGYPNELSNVSSSQLYTLDLSSNQLGGSFPVSFFKLKALESLDMSYNNFSGSLQLNMFQQLQYLSFLDLSSNSLFVETNEVISDNSNSTSSFPQMTSFKLASCGLRSFPKFLKNQTKLEDLDLSHNDLQGNVPAWIWNLENLRNLNLSGNSLVGLEGPLQDQSSYLRLLDLRSNEFQGALPFPARSQPFYLDYSNNNFSSVIPEDIGKHLARASFLSISNNSVSGSIPMSLCNATWLEVLDLSDNRLDGSVPKCLYEMTGPLGLGVLNLRGNNLNGSLSDTFPSGCNLRTLDVSGNQIEGQVPQSLSNCTKLEVLDIGKNRLSDAFPCSLKKINTLRVLVLTSNRFHGNIDCSYVNGTWPSLQIVDVGQNRFNGGLPGRSLTNWKAMMADENGEKLKPNHLGYMTNVYYQYSITVTTKGQEMIFLKILTVFTFIDFSSNDFDGPIPDEIVQLKSLYALNLSHNSLTGEISPVIGNLTHLESLDLSSNKLSGVIPHQLGFLNFLSFLNVSFNNLVGKIPTGTQLQSFTEDSFRGNKGLCGPPLTVDCDDSDEPRPSFDEDSQWKFVEWKYLSIELGFVFGLGLVIGPLIYSKKWRARYFNHIDAILSRIFPKLYS